MYCVLSFATMRCVLGLQLVVGLAAAFLPTQHRPVRPPQQLRTRHAAVCCVPDSADAALDELIRREVAAAFEGIDLESEGELDQLIADKGDAVMRSVLSKLDSDGEQLAATLEEQVAAYTREQRLEMLKKFDEDAAKVQAEMNADRQMIRGDLTRLVSLQKELDQLQGEAGGKLTKNSIVGGISFIAGLLYLGNAVNEGLRLMFGDDGSVGNFALNAGLALLGIGYYFFKKSQSDD